METRRKPWTEIKGRRWDHGYGNMAARLPAAESFEANVISYDKYKKNYSTGIRWRPRWKRSSFGRYREHACPAYGRNRFLCNKRFLNDSGRISGSSTPPRSRCEYSRPRGPVAIGEDRRRRADVLEYEIHPLKIFRAVSGCLPLLLDRINHPYSTHCRVDGRVGYQTGKGAGG